MPNPTVYPCRHIDTPIEPNGRLTAAQWQTAEPLDFFLAGSKPGSHRPQSRTTAWMLWDESYLYIGYKAMDKDIYSYLTEPDSAVCREDCLEAFLQPDASSFPYYDFEINALNTVYDSLLLNPGAGGRKRHRWARWDCAGLKSAVHIEGTINDPYDVDEYWQLEMAIPFVSLTTLKGRIPTCGEQWQFHLARCEYSVYLESGHEFSSTAMLPEIEFHDAAHWDLFEFTK
jgi:cellulose/xylan binding protein with CBM9 domain